MTKEELKNKYSAFITEISEILGLGKPVDILKLCVTTDLFFKPLEKQITELEKEVTRLRNENLDIINKYTRFAETDRRTIADLEAQIEKMKKYIKACWVEENLNDYSSYITNTSDEFRDLVKELNDEVRNGR